MDDQMEDNFSLDNQAWVVVRAEVFKQLVSVAQQAYLFAGQVTQVPECLSGRLFSTGIGIPPNSELDEHFNAIEAEVTSAVKEQMQ